MSTTLLERSNRGRSLGIVSGDRGYHGSSSQERGETSRYSALTGDDDGDERELREGKEQSLFGPLRAGDHVGEYERVPVASQVVREGSLLALGPSSSRTSPSFFPAFEDFVPAGILASTPSSARGKGTKRRCSVGQGSLERTRTKVVGQGGGDSYSWGGHSAEEDEEGLAAFHFSSFDNRLAVNHFNFEDPATLSSNTDSTGNEPESKTPPIESFDSIDTQSFPCFSFGETQSCESTPPNPSHLPSETSFPFTPPRSRASSFSNYPSVPSTSTTNSFTRQEYQPRGPPSPSSFFQKPSNPWTSLRTSDTSPRTFSPSSPPPRPPRLSPPSRARTQPLPPHFPPENPPRSATVPFQSTTRETSPPRATVVLNRHDSDAVAHLHEGRIPSRGQLAPTRGGDEGGEGAARTGLAPIVNTGNVGSFVAQEGDWTCETCGFVNWRRRKICMRCFPFANDVASMITINSQRAAALASQATTSSFPTSPAPIASPAQPTHLSSSLPSSYFAQQPRSTPFPIPPVSPPYPPQIPHHQHQHQSSFYQPTFLYSPPLSPRGIFLPSPGLVSSPCPVAYSYPPPFTHVPIPLQRPLYSPPPHSPPRAPPSQLPQQRQSKIIPFYYPASITVPVPISMSLPIPPITVPTTAIPVFVSNRSQSSSNEETRQKSATATTTAQGMFYPPFERVASREADGQRRMVTGGERGRSEVRIYPSLRSAV